MLNPFVNFSVTTIVGPGFIAYSTIFGKWNQRCYAFSLFFDFHKVFGSYRLNYLPTRS